MCPLSFAFAFERARSRRGPRRGPAVSLSLGSLAVPRGRSPLSLPGMVVLSVAEVGEYSERVDGVEGGVKGPCCRGIMGASLKYSRSLRRSDLISGAVWYLVPERP